MPDWLLLDISGCAHLYGGERELIADLSGRLEKSAFRLFARHCRHHWRCLGCRTLWRTGKLCLR
jgi:hypothetical protein